MTNTETTPAPAEDAPPVVKRKRPTRRQISEWTSGGLFLLPAVAFLVFTSLYPLLYALVLTLFRWDLKISPEKKFIGPDNFTHALRDVEFHNSLWVTLTFVVVTVLIELVLGMAIALLVTRQDARDAYSTFTFTHPNGYDSGSRGDSVAHAAKPRFWIDQLLPKPAGS